MKTNSLLTYLLYALLAALIIAAGFKACQMQKEKQQKAQEQAEWEESRRKLFPETDTVGGGSSYVSSDSLEQSATNKNPSATQSGIEDEPTKTTPTKTTAPPTNSQTTPKPKTSPTNTQAAKGAGSGRYSVQAGAFSNISGARKRLEEIIQMGFPNAEISKSGKYHVVVVMRTNDKAKAVQINDQLERRGMDATVKDRNRKN